MGAGDGGGGGKSNCTPTKRAGGNLFTHAEMLKRGGGRSFGVVWPPCLKGGGGNQIFAELAHQVSKGKEKTR